MSNVRCINFMDLCRICTASSENKINIYSSDGREKNLSQKIAECLSVQIDEKDRLPKVICAQCAQQVEQIHEMRNISKNSQAILNNWLNHRTLQSDDKVFIKDAVNDSGKSLSVLNTTASSSSSSSNQPTDLITVMQACRQVQQQQPQQHQQQYTFTIDSHVQPQAQGQAQPEAKIEKHNTLEEFIRLKPDIKITPLGKKDSLQSAPSSNTISNIKQLQPQQQQQQLQQQQLQPQQQQQHVQLQAQTLTAMPTAAPQLQLQPPQFDISMLLQQQALLQQLQQLHAQAQFTTCGDDGMNATECKKPKLNFVLSSPAAAPSQFAGSLQQLGNVAAGAQTQIQFQLLPGGASSNTPTANIAAAQPAQQFNAGALLSLTGSQLVGGNGAANMLSPNKCFLPITIRDENSDQQIVAHIDTKNLVLPTTYQVQMKLQPQLATADGQPIMQLTPTSIPATLQLTPQTLGNTTAFQAATTTQQNQFLVPQPQPQQHQQQQQQQQQHQQPVQQHQQHHQQHIQQQQQQITPSTAQVTSQQIIRSPHGKGINSQVVIRNVSSEPGTPIASSPDSSVTFKMPSPRPQQQQQQQQHQQQNKYKIQTTSVNSIATSAAVASNNATQPEFGKRVAQVNKEQSVAPSNVAALQRLSSNTTITKLPKQQQPVVGHKLPLLNKQNITISRISTQAPVKTEPKPAAPGQVQAQPLKPQPAPAPPALALQQLPQTPANILTQRKITRKPPEQPANQKAKPARSQQQILPVPVQQAAAQPQTQQQQQQLVNSTVAETPTATPANALTCPTCQREFKKKEHLTQHVKLHEGLRPFKCTEEGCDKSFSRKEHLSRHLVSHSGQKMFTCEECKKPFSRKDNLNKHKRTHNTQPGETRLHNCEICSKNFASKQHYEKHREMHKKLRVDNAASTTQPTSGAHPASKDRYDVKQESAIAAQTQATQSPMQMQQQTQQQPQIMHLNLDRNTITITQSSDSSMPSSLDFVQLGFQQFQNANGQTNQLVCKLEK